MKNLSDIRSLIFLSVAWGFQLIVMFSPKEIFSPSVLIVLFLLNVIFVLQASLINHNHRHCGIFHSQILNRCVDRMISSILLSPSTRLHAVHMFNHHTHYRSGEKDWASYKLATKHSSGFLRSLEYLKNSSREMFKNRPTLNLPEELRRNQKVERVFIVVYVGILLFINPFMTLFWLIPSCVFGLFLLLLANLVNHDRCDLESEFNHSRNFHSRFENWFFCNNGYHTAHHLKPAMHWSKYPDFHKRELLEKMDSELNEGSLLVYYLKNYLWPRK
ncbi:fatty acid desaturase family protein [Bdellovibrio sp. HCB-110]|uniref:fatty acid desaturase family protein n=1 Tax=Bdellovibrio sp. HCB-110 TaxID=3391182 RepID=UPI0039B3D4D7